MEFGPGIDDPDDDEPSLPTPDPGQLPGSLAQPTPAPPGASREGQGDTRYPDVVVQLTGEDGNAFAILGTVRRALRQAGHSDEVDEFFAEATSGDYQHLLWTCMRWVTVR